jgi:hypothetical protein
MGRTLRADAGVGTFALLALAGPVVGAASLVFWADETWGPRFLHTAVAPMAMALAVARAGQPLEWRREGPLLALGTTGAAISLLGVLFYYGAVHQAMTEVRENTLETLQYDTRWNPIRFNAALFRGWITGDANRGVAIQWPPDSHRWFPSVEEGFRARAPERVNIQPFAVPQPYVFQVQKPWPLRLTCLLSLVCGLGLWVWTVIQASRRPA